MHAVVVNVTINDQDAATTQLRDQVVPGVSGMPGFVAGYWTRKGDNGLSMGIWESEDAADTAAERVRSMAPAGVTVNAVEVREVVASA
jgi:heme-degrading monooxygenase HmoA